MDYPPEKDWIRICTARIFKQEPFADLSVHAFSPFTELAETFVKREWKD